MGQISMEIFGRTGSALSGNQHLFHKIDLPVRNRDFQPDLRKGMKEPGGDPPHEAMPEHQRATDAQPAARHPAIMNQIGHRRPDLGKKIVGSLMQHTPFIGQREGPAVPVNQAQRKRILKRPHLP